MHAALGEKRSLVASHEPTQDRENIRLADKPSRKCGRSKVGRSFGSSNAFYLPLTTARRVHQDVGAFCGEPGLPLPRLTLVVS